VLEIETRALREQSPEVLRVGLVRLLIEGEDEWIKDWRDLMVAMAPSHDCARRLGLDPVVLFDAAAEEGPRSLRGVVRDFGRRNDVTPEAFAYVVTDTNDGPRYDSAPFRF
jgi:hypothetical protein